MSQEEPAPRSESCPEREQLLKRAASARREDEELKHQLGILIIGSAEYRAVSERARAALQAAELAMSEYLQHIQEHRC